MPGPEDYLNREIDRKRRQAARAARHPAPSEEDTERIVGWMPDKETLRKAHELAKFRSAEAVDMEDPFFDGIPKEKREADQAYVRDLKQKIASEDDAYAREMAVVSSAFEYVIAKRINDSGWLGDMRAQLTSERDDLHNGIDLYVERNGKPVGLSFDVTFSKRQDSLEKKLRKMKKQIHNGSLEQLEYYMPLDPAKRAEMGVADAAPLRLPKVIVGVTKEEMATAINRFYENRDAKPDAPTGLIMLFQVKYQLERTIAYCEAQRETYPMATHVVPAYTRALAEVQDAWQRKLAELKLTDAVVEGFARKDPFTRNLLHALDTTMPLNSSP